MQRAAAAQAAAAANAQSSAAQPDDHLHAAKRPRLSTDGPRAPSHASDLEAISAAVAAEEQKRAEAVARQAAEAGETEWVLDFPGAEEMGAGYAPQPYIVPAGSLDAEDEGMGYGGRRSYGNFKRKKVRLEISFHLWLLRCWNLVCSLLYPVADSSPRRRRQLPKTPPPKTPTPTTKTSTRTTSTTPPRSTP